MSDTVKLATLENEMEEADYLSSIDLPINLDEAEKTQHDNKWWSYCEQNSALVKQRGQAFLMI